MDKSIFKMSSEELQNWLYQRKRGYAKKNKKGKGSYKRKERSNKNEQ